MAAAVEQDVVRLDISIQNLINHTATKVATSSRRVEGCITKRRRVCSTEVGNAVNLSRETGLVKSCIV